MPRTRVEFDVDGPPWPAISAWAEQVHAQAKVHRGGHRHYIIGIPWLGSAHHVDIAKRGERITIESWLDSGWSREEWAIDRGLGGGPQLQADSYWARRRLNKLLHRLGHRGI